MQVTIRTARTPRTTLEWYRETTVGVFDDPSLYEVAAKVHRLRHGQPGRPCNYPEYIVLGWSRLEHSGAQGARTLKRDWAVIVAFARKHVTDPAWWPPDNPPSAATMHLYRRRIAADLRSAESGFGQSADAPTDLYLCYHPNGSLSTLGLGGSTWQTRPWRSNLRSTRPDGR